MDKIEEFACGLCAGITKALEARRTGRHQRGLLVKSLLWGSTA